MPILVELQRTLTYARVQKRWPLTRDIIENYARALEQAAFIVELPEPWPAVISDPDDDPILQTAVLGQADVLCTRDTAFGHRLVQEVCTAHGIRVMDDISLIDELRHFSDPSRSH
jgi:predicted nucleic acid-binding protein